ncbi:MAG: hypothetical protein MZW92_40515 [Comamonadaceae bacterium]|nr:hypothetical protein [Comamonadaceae bacterium]
MMADLPAFDAMWKALVDARVIWRYMTFAEAVRFAAEELAWRQSEGPVGDVPGEAGGACACSATRRGSRSPATGRCGTAAWAPSRKRSSTPASRPCSSG